MEITSLKALIDSAGSIFGIIDKGVKLAKSVIVRKKKTKEEIKEANELLGISMDNKNIVKTIKKTFEFLFIILPEMAILHAMSDKMREIVMSNRTALTAQNSKYKDGVWNSVFSMYQQIFNIHKGIIMTFKDKIALPNSAEIGVLIEKCDSFEKAMNDGSSYITARDVKLLENACNNMSSYAAVCEALSQKYIKELLEGVFIQI